MVKELMRLVADICAAFLRAIDMSAAYEGWQK